MEEKLMESQQNLMDREFASYDGNYYEVYHTELISILRSEAVDLADLCHQFLLILNQHSGQIALNSGGIYRFVMECTRCEDLLDSVHAGQTDEWAYYRKLIAMIKHSCSITSDMQYLVIHSEQMRDSVEGNFRLANEFVAKQAYKMLEDSCQRLLDETKRLGILEQGYVPQLIYAKYFIADIQALLRLKRNSQGAADKRTTDSTKNREWLLHLVCTLLNHCDLIGYFAHIHNVPVTKRKDAIQNELHEEVLSAQCELFHSALTFYDTQCAQKDTPIDIEMEELIKHVKVLYQLFHSLSTLMRIEERHLAFFTEHDLPFTLADEEMQSIVFDFFVNYIDRFRLQVEKISKRLVQKYSVQKEVILPVPIYRGFHVRPSTLVAKIVMHYGSKVIMRLCNTNYNAAVPLDLFRANEVINAEKRCLIGNLLTKNKDYPVYAKLCRKKQQADPSILKDYFLLLFQYLQQEEKVVVYQVIDKKILEDASTGEDFYEYVKREIAYLVATGMIDIVSDLKVVFEGDSHVLTDISILAEHGYGEDKAGNNIPLPKELSYLRR